MDPGLDEKMVHETMAQWRRGDWRAVTQKICRGEGVLVEGKPGQTML